LPGLTCAELASTPGLLPASPGCCGPDVLGCPIAQLEAPRIPPRWSQVKPAAPPSRTSSSAPPTRERAAPSSTRPAASPRRHGREAQSARAAAARHRADRARPGDAASPARTIRARDSARSDRLFALATAMPREHPLGLSVTGDQLGCSEQRRLLGRQDGQGLALSRRLHGACARSPLFMLTVRNHSGGTRRVGGGRSPLRINRPLGRSREQGSP